MNTLELGPLSLNLHRTVRVKNTDEASNLPPSLGVFDLFKVSDFNCPKGWDKDGYFIAMFPQEAMWMSFQTMEPVALMVGAGKINAVDGKQFGEKLEKDNYMVSPPQPWLDGWKSDDGNVFQFIAAEVGENITVGEQLAETKEHAILISVFKAKNPEKLQATSRPSEMWGSEYGDMCCMSFAVGGFPDSCNSLQQCASGSANLESLTCEMGLGKGGKIKQKIYEDPHGIEEWVDQPLKTVKVYLINASEFAEITGQALPPPVTAEQYDGIWFGLKDKDQKDVPGTNIFDKLKSAI